MSEEKKEEGKDGFEKFKRRKREREKDKNVTMADNFQIYYGR